ncbi:hypothetical protein D3C71_1422040 [compost metagenome]
MRSRLGLGQRQDTIQRRAVAGVQPFRVPVYGPNQRHRALRAGLMDLPAGLAQRVRELHFNQLDHRVLDLWVVGQEYGIACSAGHEGAVLPVVATKAHQVRRQGIGDIAGGSLASGIAVVNQVVGQQAGQGLGRSRSGSAGFHDQAQFVFMVLDGHGLDAVAAVDQHIGGHARQVSRVQVQQRHLALAQVARTLELDAPGPGLGGVHELAVANAGGPGVAGEELRALHSQNAFRVEL